MGIRFNQNVIRLDQERMHLLEAFVGLASMAINRIKLTEQARKASNLAEQMNMVVHQTVPVKPIFLVTLFLLKRFQKAQAIIIVEENVSSIDSLQNHMINATPALLSRLSYHA